MRSAPQQPSHRIFALVSFSRSLVPTLFACVLALASFAVHAQQDPPTDPPTNPPASPNPDPDSDPDPNSIVPKEEPVNPVTITVSVSPTSIAAYTGTATLSWSSLNANVCEYDETERSVSGRESVGPFSSSGTKSFSVSCTGDGEGSFAEVTADLTVTRAPAPRITTTLSAAVLEAGVDSLTVTWSTQYADYCSAGGNNSYPTGGTANLGTYAAGTHSLSFSCTGDGGTTPRTIRWKAVNRVTVRPSVSPSTIKANDSDTVTVSWNSPDADSCSHDGTDYTNSDSIPFGPYSYSETGTKSATITCRNMLGSASDSVSWTVERDDPDPPPRPPRNLQAAPNPSTDGRFTLSWERAIGWHNRDRLSGVSARILQPPPGQDLCGPHAVVYRHSRWDLYIRCQGLFRYGKRAGMRYRRCGDGDGESPQPAADGAGKSASHAESEHRRQC